MRGAFCEGLITNVLNPKVSMFYLAAFPQFMTVDAHIMDAYALVSVHSLINFLWFSLMVMLLAQVQSRFNQSYFKRCLQSCIGVVLIALGGKLLVMKNN